MKIEKLTDNKIRIILDIDDLIKKNIDIHSLVKDNAQSQKLFKKILTEAKKEVGFDTQDCRLLIEAFISSEGFFVVTVTKLINDSTLTTLSTARPKAKRKNLNNTCHTAIYEFNSFEDFESFCTYLNNTKDFNIKGFAKKISFYEYNSQYFLIFSEIDSNFKKSAFLYTSISEFAKLSSNSMLFESKLFEYGKAIFKNNAIQNGIKYFSKA